ncbi:SDR family oxidoreductase [Halocynthiibacter namhaensis]|uniref:SDR family oxidoreductase n=1 Tax=Halocynthiibacter namhaensis TaxID=1290553 RepID=UPI0005791B9D|nr:SDR family oxidoreductase [Halocynthiibacter namhaensis]
MTKHLLSIGHGLSARTFSPLLQAQGWSITGTTRSAEKAEIIAKTGVTPLIWPTGDLDAAIAQADAILISSGPSAEGCPVLTTSTKAIIKRAPHLTWVGYLSTTGVYGDHQGGWVTEDTKIEPATRRGQWRKDAENAWLKLATDHGLPVHIFRLAGIYGPGRGPIAKILNGTARRIIKKNQVFSRIHVDDIAQVLLASLNAPNPGRVYNVCDNDPAPPQDVLAHAARLLGRDVPPEEDFETAEMTPMARSFYATSKRVSNKRITSELGVTLKYPDYKSCLQALMD